MFNWNLGLFSERSLEDINECTYDPPYVGKGSAPGWAAGSSKQVEQITDGIPDYSAPASDDYGGYGDDYAYDYRRRRSAGRQKRFDMNAAYGKIITNSPERDVLFCLGGDYYGDTYGADSYGYGDDYYGGTYDPVVLECLANDPSGGHDANAWIKTPGKFKMSYIFTNLISNIFKNEFLIGPFR